MRSLEGEALTRWLSFHGERTWAAQFAATTDDQWARMAEQVRRDIAAGDTFPIDSVSELMR